MLLTKQDLHSYQWDAVNFILEKEAGRATGVHPTHIGQACDFKWGHNKAKGFLWEK